MKLRKANVRHGLRFSQTKSRTSWEDDKQKLEWVFRTEVFKAVLSQRNKHQGVLGFVITGRISILLMNLILAVLLLLGGYYYVIDDKA